MTTQTVQLTSKKWKALFGVGAATLCCSAVTCGTATNDPETALIGLGLFVVGFAAAVTGRVGAWWNHA